MDCFSPDDALGWSFGDSGVLQYWIHPPISPRAASRTPS
jgi:hypothetical protein